VRRSVLGVWYFINVTVVILGLLLPEARCDFTVSPVVQTPPPSPTASLDPVDDTTIWLHPDDPSLSVVIVTNKDHLAGPDIGLHLYDLDGNLLSSVTGKRQNNVDVRYGFPLGGASVDIIASTNQTDETIDFFTIDPTTRSLTVVGSIPSGFSGPEIDIGPAGRPMGIALWNNRADDSFYVFVSDNDIDGSIRQFQLFDDGGAISGRLVRSWDVGSHCEGMVVDDSRGGLFLAEEAVGIWHYAADPQAGTGSESRTAVGQGPDKVNAHDGDVEGLAIFTVRDWQGENGYLLASEQGVATYAILERYDQDGDGNLFEFLGRFNLEWADGSGEIRGTDGIAAISTGLNDAFSEGLLVAHDGRGDNFKFVSWTDIVAAAAGDNPSLILASDPGFDPRRVATTPEPSTIGLLATGVLGLVACARRRKRLSSA